MLIKKELQDLPLSHAPAPTKAIPLTAGAAIHQLSRCGKVLALDVYEKRKLLFRFFSDGKNFITWSEQADVRGWTRRNQFITEDIRYHPINAKKSHIKIIAHVLKVKPYSTNILHQVEEYVSEFIAHWHKQKKNRAIEAKYRLMERHLDMLPAYPANLDKFCENHVFHRSIVYLYKLEKGKRRGHCMHCGKRFRLDRSAKPGSGGVCPKCGFPIRFRGEWATKPSVE